MYLERHLQRIPRGQLPGKKGFFSIETPSVAGKFSPGDDPVTGDQDGDIIRPDGPSNGSGGFGSPDGPCDFPVGEGGSFGNAAEEFPDRELKGGPDRHQGNR